MLLVSSSNYGYLRVMDKNVRRNVSQNCWEVYDGLDCCCNGNPVGFMKQRETFEYSTRKYEMAMLYSLFPPFVCHLIQNSLTSFYLIQSS